MLKIINDGLSKVVSVSEVCLQTNMGMQLLLKGVKHVSDVYFNLIFVHMLNDGCYDKDTANVMDMKAFLWHRRISHISQKRLKF